MAWIFVSDVRTCSTSGRYLTYTSPSKTCFTSGLESQVSYLTYSNSPWKRWQKYIKCRCVLIRDKKRKKEKKSSSNSAETPASRYSQRRHCATSAVLQLYWKLKPARRSPAQPPHWFNTWNIKMIGRNSLRRRQSDVPLILTSGKSGVGERRRWRGRRLRRRRGRGGDKARGKRSRQGTGGFRGKIWKLEGEEREAIDWKKDVDQRRAGPTLSFKSSEWRGRAQRGMRGMKGN